MARQNIDPKYDPKAKHPHPSGNEGRLHEGLKHPGYTRRPRPVRRK